MWEGVCGGDGHDGFAVEIMTGDVVKEVYANNHQNMSSKQDKGKVGGNEGDGGLTQTKPKLITRCNIRFIKIPIIDIKTFFKFIHAAFGNGGTII